MLRVAVPNKGTLSEPAAGAAYLAGGVRLTRTDPLMEAGVARVHGSRYRPPTSSRVPDHGGAQVTLQSARLSLLADSAPGDAGAGIPGTGAQNLPITRRKGCSVVSGIVLAPNFASR